LSGRTTLILALTVLAIGAGAPQAHAEHPEIARGRAAEQTAFTDAQIFEGFFKIAFGAELRLAGRSDRIRKYDRPVRVFVESNAAPDRREAVANVVSDIRRHIEHLDIAMIDDAKQADVTVHLVRDRDLARTLRKAYGTRRARAILRKLDPQCLSSFAKDATFRIVRSDVFLVADAGEFTFYDCAYEEILQSLGPINDDASVPWTMFNDNVRKGFFDVYDQYILNILYHPLVRPGMTRADLRALLPRIMPDVRAWVAQMNGPPK
jgi:hypothetical protein